MRIVAEEDDKEATHENEEGGAGRVGDLELVAAGDELTAIPEAAGRFHGHDEDSTGDNTHDPAHDIVHSIETHNVFFGTGKPTLICPIHKGRMSGYFTSNFFTFLPASVSIMTK
jgi:hypothetical protein